MLVRQIYKYAILPSPEVDFQLQSPKSIYDQKKKFDGKP